MEQFNGKIEVGTGSVTSTPLFLTDNTCIGGIMAKTSLPKSSLSAKTCSVEGCNKPHLARGYCNQHYWRWRVYRDPTKKRYSTPAEPILCSVPKCDRVIDSRGLCSMHYQRFRKRGTTEPNTLARAKGQSLAERVAEHTPRLPEDQCWPWTGNLKNGYGYFSFRRKWTAAHRAAFFVQNGHLPIVVRHMCDNPACVNPAHLTGGTQADNVRDMIERGRHRSPKGKRNKRVK